MIDSTQLRQLRLRAQHLHPAARQQALDVGGLVRNLCGLQAQDLPAATLGVRPRSVGLTASDVEHALFEDRTIVRTWAMRGTLHLVAADDLRWLLELLGPLFVRKSQRRYAQLGLTDDICAAAVRAMRDLLGEHGSLTRADLIDGMTRRDIPTEGQAAYHLLGHAAFKGVICFGPGRDGQQTFVLVEDWVGAGRTVSGDAASAELARRYLSAYGPATPHDMAAWSGLPVREARAAFESIADQLVEVEVDGATLWMLKSREGWLEEPAEGDSGVLLLPAFDTFLLGYRGRDLLVPPPYAKRVNAGGGMIRPVVLVNGQAAGTWRIKRRKDSLAVLVQPFEPEAAAWLPALEDEVADVGRFLGKDATLKMETP